MLGLRLEDLLREITAHAAEHPVFFGGVLEIERELAHGDWSVT
jgi:hypothetical protein